MLAAHLALRYLRRRRMAWLAMGAVSLTVGVSVVVLGVMEGWVSFTRTQVRAAESDLTIKSARPLPQALPVVTALMKHDFIESVAPFVESPAAMVTDSRRKRMIPVKTEGVHWENDRAIGRLADAWLHQRPGLDLSAPPLDPEERGSGFLTQEARAFTALHPMELTLGLVPGLAPAPPRASNPFRPGLILGRELLYEQGGLLRIGDTAKLALPDGRGGLVGQVRGEISDTVGTGVLEIDRYAVLMPLPQGQQLTDNDGRARNSNGAAVDGYRIKLKSDADLELSRHELMSDPDLGMLLRQYPHGISTWKELRGNTVRIVELNLRTLRLVMIVLQGLCIFTVAAVFSTLVAEKRHDIGVLLGMGAKPGSILMTFLAASMTACCIGGLIGWGAGWLGLALLNPVSEAIGKPLFPQSVFYTDQAPIEFDVRTPLQFIALQMSVGLASAWWPAWRASRINPVDTIREAG